MNTWKKIFAMSVLGVALSAVAQVNMRPQVAKSLQSAQEAIQAKQPDVALQKIQEARTTPDLTEPEKMFLERLSVVAALEAQKFDVASRSLTYLLQSKSLSTADRLTLTETMVNVSQRNKEHASVVLWARQYAQEGGTSQRVYLMKVQALALQGLHKEVLQDMQEAVKAPGYQPEEAELRIYAFSQKQLKDEAGYMGTLTQLATRFPSKDYWADLLNSMGRLPSLSARAQLDVSRLMEATGTLEEAEDYLDAAQFGIKAGLPHDALRILELGQAAGLYKGATAASYAKLKQQAQQRATEDEKALKSLTLTSDNGTVLVQLGDVLLSKGQWVEAAQAYQKALGKGGLKREAEARLHCGMALLKAQEGGQAKAMLISVNGDAFAVHLASLWTSLVK
jgi:Tfp pilus assembly protein PilF